MKKIIAIAMLLSISKSLSAQNFEEWFRQKATQKKYLLQQIAALQVYIGYVSKGYTIAKNGLNTIQNFKDGDFNLHDTYFKSLASVNPKVKRYSKVAQIILLQIAIVKQVSFVVSYCKRSKQLTLSEIAYLEKVFDNLLSDCSKSLYKLIAVTTDGSLSMKDDERIIAIDDLYDDMVDKQAFCQFFGQTSKGLCMQRINDQSEIIFSKKLNDIK